MSKRTYDFRCEIRRDDGVLIETAELPGLTIQQADALMWSLKSGTAVPDAAPLGTRRLLCRQIEIQQPQPFHRRTDIGIGTRRLLCRQIEGLLAAYTEQTGELLGLVEGLIRDLEMRDGKVVGATYKVQARQIETKGKD